MQTTTSSTFLVQSDISKNKNKVVPTQSSDFRKSLQQSQAERTSPKQKFLFSMVKHLCALGSCTLSFVALCKLRYGKCVPVHIIQRNGISSMESSLLILGTEILTVCCKAYTANDLVQKDKETLLLNVLFITSVEEKKNMPLQGIPFPFVFNIFFLFYIRRSAVSLTRLRTKSLNLRKAYFRKVGILSQVFKIQVFHHEK